MSTTPPSNPEPAQGHGPLWVFTPSRTDPRDLEFILVQRHSLLRDAVERVRESVLTANKHHLLFAGPRGSGKTHLVTLIVSRLGNDGEISDRMRLAWLNEDETCTTLLEFLLRIHAALGKRYPAEFSEEALEPAYGMKPDDALKFVSGHLLSVLGQRTLVVVRENLDAVFEAMGDAGQKQLRAFIQENPRLSIVSTAQRLDENLLSRTSPFFGFFQVNHLKPLNLQQAVELLQNIARLNGSHDVAEFLATNRGRSRVRALHHLSGGNHRIHMVLSQFITRDSIDALLGPFMKMVDELTPYFQERIRWLSPTQRKIVEYLCICEETVPVKAIARRLFATPQSVSSQLQDLREKGCVESNQRGREFLYEVREPLMRLCVEVKDNQRLLPLRLLVDFLRVWYDDHELKRRLPALKLSPSSAACVYLETAVEKDSIEGNLREKPDFASLEDPPGTFKMASAGMHLRLAEIHFREGQWKEGFRMLESHLQRSLNPDPAYQAAPANGIVDAFFSAGLSFGERFGKISFLLRLCSRHQALPILGVGVVRHIGQVLRAGEPFPSTDNLETWASAWEQAAEEFPDFKLSLRLLRTGVHYLKTGGKDQGILLSLTFQERSILRQAFDLEGASQTAAP